MAFNHGRVAVLKIDDSGGTLRDVSASCTGCDLDQGVDIPDTSTFGNPSSRLPLVPPLKTTAMTPPTGRAARLLRPSKH